MAEVRVVRVEPDSSFLLTLSSPSPLCSPAMARLARLAVVALSVASAACKPDAAAVARFREYLRIRTEQPSPDYTAAALFLEAQGREIGLEVETIRYAQHKPLVLLTWQGSAPELPSIMLNSHTDVVPAEASFWRCGAPAERLRARGERRSQLFPFTLSRVLSPSA